MTSVPQTAVHSQFKNILLTTDFSACSEATIPYARAIAKRHGATVHLLHVAEGPLAPGEFVPDLDNEDIESARRKIEAIAGSGSLEGVAHAASVRTGVVWDAVADAVRDLQIDLTIVGTHGDRGVKQFLLGSVAEQVLRHVSCPVLSIGPEIRRRDLAVDEIRTVLFATDLSSTPRHVLDYGLRLVGSAAAKLILLHAIDPEQAEGEKIDSADAERRLSKLLEGHPGIVSQIVVERGPAAETILTKATATSADLIVMGAHGGAMAAHIPWAIARQVICHAPCPVLSLRR